MDAIIEIVEEVKSLKKKWKNTKKQRTNLVKKNQYELNAMIQQHKDNLKELRRKYMREINKMESDQEKQRKEQMERNEAEFDSIVVREAEERRSLEEAIRTVRVSLKRKLEGEESVAPECPVCMHNGEFPMGVGHRVENGWGLTKVAVVLLNGLIW